MIGLKKEGQASYICQIKIAKLLETENHENMYLKSTYKSNSGPKKNVYFY